MCDVFDAEGTRNLLDAARAARARVIAQSISWEIPSSGPGTYYEPEPPAPPRIHVDDAARLTLPALDVQAAVTMVIDDRALPGSASRTGGQP